MELTWESDRSSSSRVEVDSTLSNQRKRVGEATEDGYDAYRRWFGGQNGESEGSEESYDDYAGREPGYYELEMTDRERDERSEALHDMLETQWSLTQEIDYLEGRIDLSEEVDKFMAAKAQERKDREDELDRHIEHLV